MAKKHREESLRYLPTNRRFRPKRAIWITDGYAAFSAMQNQPSTQLTDAAHPSILRNPSEILFAAKRPKVIVMNKNDKDSDKEPDWMNPANDRKTPYTEEELDTFVEDFILGLDDQDWLAMKSELGEEKTREKIRAGFVKMDERNLTNITPKGPVN